MYSNQLTQKKVDLIVSELQLSGLLKTPAEAGISGQLFEQKLRFAITEGVLKFTASGAGRRGPASVRG